MNDAEAHEESPAASAPAHARNRLLFPLLLTGMVVAAAASYFLYGTFVRRGESVEDLLAARAVLFLAHLALVAALVTIILFVLRARRPRVFAVAKRWIERLALLLASIALTLVIAEILTRLLLEEQLVQLELQNLHRVSQNENILYELRPNAYLRFFYKAENDWIEYKINSLGFREDETTREKPPHTFRILVVGDSVSFGIRVNHPEVYTERLEEYLNARRKDTALRYEVINASVCAWNTFNEVSFIAARGINLAPNLIILQFHPNDLDNPTPHLGTTAVYHFRHIPDEYYPNPDVPERRNSIFTRSARDFSMFEVAKWFGKKYSTFCRFAVHRYQTWRARSQPHAAGSMTKWFLNCLQIIYERKSPEWQWLKRRCDDLRRVAAERNIPVVILIPPLSYQLNSMQDDETQPPKILSQLFAQYGFKPLDLTPYFARTSSQDQFFYYLPEDESHWNTRGHDMVADVLCNFLHEQNLVPE